MIKKNKSEKETIVENGVKEVDIIEELNEIIEETNIIRKEPKKKNIKKNQCQIILTSKNKAFVELGGQNFRVINKDNKEIGDFLEIEYTGTIGKDDFNIV